MESHTAQNSADLVHLKVEPRSQYKSYRKKYHKIRAQFSKTLGENNVAWDGEQNMQRVVRRLEEELDQLRELLIDVNESKTCPKHLTICLSSADHTDDAWLRDANVLPPTSHLDRILQEKGDDYKQAEGYSTMHQEYQRELRRGESTLSDYKSAYKAALPFLEINKSLAYLEDTVPHTKLSDVPRQSLPPEITDDAPVGYLHPDREAEYLERLDAEIAERWSNLGKLTPEQRLAANSPHVNYAARDNPTSALNWLRKYQPEIFLDSTDAPGSRSQDSGKLAYSGAASLGQSSASINRRESGRAKRGSHALQEVLDDDGSVIGTESMSKSRGGSKRKRTYEDDDISYHPSKGTTAPKKRVRKSAMEMAAERD